MLKKYRTTLILGTLVMLLPILAGLILWDHLPEQVPIHFNGAGEADSWSSRAVAVFVLPGTLIGIHWLCTLISLRGDPKAENLQGKVMSLVLWLCPVLSILVMGLLYGRAMGAAVQVQVVLPLFLGLQTVIIGNWLPKCKQTYTLGIRLPWTLADENNWNRTHRFAGPVWVVGGLLMMLASLADGVQAVLVVAVLLVMVTIPTVYSYLLFRGKIK